MKIHTIEYGIGTFSKTMPDLRSKLAELTAEEFTQIAAVYRG